MKKIILLFLGIVLITGCSNNKEKELCDKFDKIDVQGYTENENYEELTSVLQKNYDEYCDGVSSDVCNALDKFIDSTKEELEFEDCSGKQGSLKEICESNNSLKIVDKNTNINYTSEEVWSFCND